MLKSIHKSKNRHFYHIFVFPGDAPGTITLNVALIEREFDSMLTNFGDMCNRLDRIPACDRQSADRQTYDGHLATA